MSSQAKQVFYINDPFEKRWSIVLQRKHIPHSDENHYLKFNILETLLLTQHMCNIPYFNLRYFL